MKATRVLEVLVHEGLVPQGIFQIEKHHIDSYIECYSNIFGKDKGLKKTSEISLARKIAGLNLLKHNFNLGAKFNDLKAGIVYLVENPVFKDHIKVGMTIDLISRLESYQTSDPFREFKVVRYDFVMDRFHIEKQILCHPDALKESGEWLKRDSALELFDKIVKNK